MHDRRVDSSLAGPQPARLVRDLGSAQPGARLRGGHLVGAAARSVAAHRSLLAAVVAAAAAALYVTTGLDLIQTTYPALAAALLDGQLSVPFMPELELVPVGDRGYVAMPPAPTLIHLPFVASGIPISAQLLGGAVAAVGVGLTMELLNRMRVALLPAVLITAGVATSTLWYVATEAGRMWMTAHVLAVALGMAAMLLAWTGRWPLAAGLLLGLAAASRLPMGLMLPAILFLYRSGGWRSWISVGAGVAVIAAPVALYNVARFGSPFDFGYGRIPSTICPGTVHCEPWYQDGILSLSYIPRSLGAALLSGFHIRNEAPWLLAAGTSLSLAISAPIYIVAARGAGGRLGLVLAGSALLVMLPNLAHGNWGSWQYGYRYILDAAPLLVVLAGLAYRDRAEKALVASVALGCIATIYGLLLFHVWRVYP